MSIVKLDTAYVVRGWEGGGIPQAWLRVRSAVGEE